MFAARVMAAVVLGGLIAGCQQPKTPPPSSLAAGDAMALSQHAANYRAAHPGSEVGLVNAVLPERRIVSIEGLPAELIKNGDVVTILGGNGKTPMEAVVYAQSAGFVQVRYEQLPAGQLDPMAGDLAVWYPAKAGTPMGPVTPIGTLREPPATGPTETPYVPAAPATMPASTTETPAAPPAQSAAPVIVPPASGPAASDAMPATLPASRPALDFNK